MNTRGNGQPDPPSEVPQQGTPCSLHGPHQLVSACSSAPLPVGSSG